MASSPRSEKTGRKPSGPWTNEAGLSKSHTPTGRLSRRAALGLFAGGLIAAASPALAAPNVNSGRGAFRRVRLVSNRLGEKLDTVYWIDGEYIPEALSDVNHLMRDWRTDEVKRCDRRMVDVIAAAHRRLDTSEPFEVISGYRSAQTNAMLRSQSRGVARNSYHVQAMAADLRLSGRSVTQIARAAESLGAGGVGRYSRSQFVHVDSGPVRTWGR